MSRTGSVLRAASLSWTATPAFMSQLPQPYSSPPSVRDGRLPATGTVSMWPASATRSLRPRLVRATTTLPLRSVSRCASPASAASIAAASAASSPLTEGTSTSWAVISAGSRERSSCTAAA